LIRAVLVLALGVSASVFARAELPHVVVIPEARDARFAALPAVVFFAGHDPRARATLRLYEADGSLSESSLAVLSRLCRDFRSAREVPIAPRTLQLVYKAALHFGGADVEIVSGYRAPEGTRDTSHHAVGDAIDFRLADVPARDVAEYVRRFGRVGVGYYPRVGFVHLDVRDASYFWVNRSGARRHGWDRPLPRRTVVREEEAWTPEWDLPWFEPVLSVVDSRARADFVPRSQRHRRVRRAR
jgi:uncharacterized protein YcbK (DUF882 family)